LLDQLASRYTGRANFLAVCFDAGLEEETRVLALDYARRHNLQSISHVYGNYAKSVNLQYIPHKMFLDSHQCVVDNYEDVDWASSLEASLDDAWTSTLTEIKKVDN
jgi:hypothetical protein